MRFLRLISLAPGALLPTARRVPWWSVLRQRYHSRQDFHYNTEQMVHRCFIHPKIALRVELLDRAIGLPVEMATSESK